MFRKNLFFTTLCYQSRPLLKSTGGLDSAPFLCADLIKIVWFEENVIPVPIENVGIY